MIFHCLAADFKKTKHLPIRVAHLAIPMGIAVIFLAYYAGTPWSAQSKVAAYYQVLGIGFPVLIGLFSAMLAEQEAAAASYQAMLSANKRLPLFYSKFLLLVFSGAFSVLLASMLFGIGNVYVIRQSMVDLWFYFRAALILIGTNVALYLFHWFLALRFNKGVSIMIGIAEGIVAALMLTGLGDTIWHFIPCAWASRLVTYMVINSAGIPIFDKKCVTAVLLCIVSTVCAIVLFGIWASHWEGKQTSD